MPVINRMYCCKEQVVLTEGQCAAVEHRMAPGLSATPQGSITDY